MHGIIACSALHLAYKHPVHRGHYIVSARSHQDHAMGLFQQAVKNVTKDNCNAILAFSHLLVVFSLAEERCDENLLLTKASEAALHPLSDWLFFVRHGCFLVCDFWDEIERGPLARLAASWELPMTGDDKISPQLSRFVLFLSCEGEAEWSREVCDICSSSARTLGLAFNSADVLTDEFTIWDAVRVWPMSLPDEYLILLTQEHPAALILLAYYCLLLTKLGSLWYIAETPTRILKSIIGRLHHRWHCHISNVVDEVMT